MPALKDLQDLKRDLIRKTLNMSVFIADTAADAIDAATLFDATSGAIKTLPTGYDDLGYLTTAGAAFARAITESNVTSAQSSTPTRTDTTEDTITLQVSCQETKLATIGLGIGADLTSLTPLASGALQVDKPLTPKSKEWRVLGIAEDDTNDGPVYICRFLPVGKVTNYDTQTMARGDDPLLWPVTFQGFPDDVLGTDHRWLWGGEGWKALLTDMGFGA